jgi:hypothetical protein
MSLMNMSLVFSLSASRRQDLERRYFRFKFRDRDSEKKQNEMKKLRQ